MTRELEEVWLRTDEIEEFVSTLEHCADLASSLAKSSTNWRWLIICLHSALQGACVCALRGRDTAGVTMLTTKSAEKILQWLAYGRHETPKPPMPQERLASMVDLYDRVVSTTYLSEPYRLPGDAASAKDVRLLNSLRNEFVHFTPKGWSLEVSGLPRVVSICCLAIEHLAVKHPTYEYRLDENLRARIEIAVMAIRAQVLAWEQRRMVV